MDHGGNDIELSFDPHKAFYKKDETVTIVCTAQNTGPLSAVYFTKTIGTVTKWISANDIVQPLFADTGRYSLVWEKLRDTSVRITLTIAGQYVRPFHAFHNMLYYISLHFEVHVISSL